MSLSERFKRLPEEQQLRNEESARQAREASELLRRLKATRQEAERVAKEEIERTRRVQREELEMHPEIVDFKRRLRNAERDRETWERKQKDQERAYQIELDNLKRDEAAALNRFNFAQEEEMKMRQEQESLQLERQEKEQQFKEFDQKLDNLKREEESQFINDINVLKRQIQDLEEQIPSGDLKSNLNQIENEIRGIEDFRDRAIEERNKLAEKERQAAEDLLKAKELLRDAKNIEEDKTRQLESLNSYVVSGGGFEKSLFEAEKRLQELESTHSKAKKDRDSCARIIEDKDIRIKAIRSEIRRLEDELIGVEQSKADQYDNLYDLENKVNRSEFELRDAREQLNEIRQQNEFYAQETKKMNECKGELEQETNAAQRARQEAEIEEKRAIELCSEIGKKCTEADNLSKHNTERLEQLNRTAMDLRMKLSNYEGIKSEIEQKRAALHEVQHRWNEWRVNRFAPLQRDFESVRIWLSTHPKIEAVSIGRSKTAWNDLDRIRKRINELQGKYLTPTVNFEDPGTVRGLLDAKEQEIRTRLTERSGPVSQRLATQLEREAEALMRAEVAATHEQKQAAIEREANELSQLRLSLKPQVALDQEAQNRMWKVNQETGETGVIAAQVIELCQSRNITVKEQE